MTLLHFLLVSLSDASWSGASSINPKTNELHVDGRLLQWWGLLLSMATLASAFWISHWPPCIICQGVPSSTAAHMVKLNGFEEHHSRAFVHEQNQRKRQRKSQMSQWKEEKKRPKQSRSELLIRIIQGEMALGLRGNQGCFQWDSTWHSTDTVLFDVPFPSVLYVVFYLPLKWYSLHYNSIMAQPSLSP